MKPRNFRKNSRRVYRIAIVVCVLALVAGILIVYVNDGFELGKGFDAEEGYTTPDSDPDSNSDDPYAGQDLDDPDANPDRIENGIHVRTGLVDAPGLQETVNNCTNCHSAKLVIQNRMSAERWHATIRWMQETQNLWPLGEKEDIIVDYLVANYPPKNKGRREALVDVEWYSLKE